MALTRRELLTGAGLVAAATVLAGCELPQLPESSEKKELGEQLKRLEAIGRLAFRQGVDSEIAVSMMAGWKVMTSDQYKKLFDLGVEKILGGADSLAGDFWADILDKALESDSNLLPDGDSQGLAKNIIRA